MITLINAGPGSGKSYTLTYGYLLLSNNLLGRLTPTEEQQSIFDFFQQEFSPTATVAFFAHNNSTKDNLVRRLPKKVNVFTFHGAGQSQVIKRYGFQKPVFDRIDNFISDITGQRLRDMPAEHRFQWIAVKKLVNYLKIENMEPSQANFEYIRFKYPDMAVQNYPEDWESRCTKLLSRSAIPNRVIEFSDMLWLGVKATTRPRFDIGFVDESQDISSCAYSLVTRMCKHVVFCGDKNQAINAFAGASEEMYDRIAEKSDAIHPLKMTLRNPPFICDMANHLRPGGVIKGPNQGPGTNETIPYNTLPQKLKGCLPTNTMIIARTNAAVIGCAIQLHKLQIPCRIIDKDLATEVINFIKYFDTKSLPTLLSKIQAHEDRSSKSRSSLWAQLQADKCAYTRSLINAASSYDSLMSLIKDTFEKHPFGFPLSSIHKAKGLEAHNVFILNPPIELPCCMDHPIAKEQEINLHFVALTRSAMNLYWVS